MSRKLLEEAIADAKTLKETAIQNAKAALEESFTPHLKSLLASKLEEMEEETPEFENFSLEEDSENQEEELSLEEILKELLGSDEEETLKEEETENGDVENETEEAEETEETSDEDTEIDLENMTEEDLMSYIEEVISEMVEAGELEAGENFQQEENSEENLANMGDNNLGDENMEGLPIEEKISKDKNSAQLKAQLDEATKKIKALQLEMKEVNLLNAKLLFSNRIFKNKDLSKQQKNEVLTVMDKAKNKQEVEIIYEALNKSLRDNKKPIRESMIGSASKAIASKKTPIVETDEVILRMQKLAGII